MLRFDVALEALKRRLAPKPARPAAPNEAVRPPGGILIPFPLRKLPAPAAQAKRRAPG